MKHITDAELGRRIAANYDERTATHQAMLAPDLTPRVPVLSEEWARLGARYDALAAQSAALYAELTRRGQDRVHAGGRFRAPPGEGRGDGRVG